MPLPNILMQAYRSQDKHLCSQMKDDGVLGDVLLFVQQCLKEEHYHSKTSMTLNTDDSNSFLSSEEIFPIAQENKYSGIFYGFFLNLS